jgi:hypothetical protein
LGGEWLMLPFDIFIAYVSWGSGGKRRPMLVYKASEKDIITFPVTTQYDSKSKAIQARYFAINDWAQAGLYKPSFIDAGTPYTFPDAFLMKSEPIGRLTDNDKRRLVEFLGK